MFSTILEAFTEQASSRPDSIALQTPGKRDTTFGELFDRNEKMRRRLAQFGIQPGMRVGLIVPTRDSMAGAHLALVTTATSAPYSSQTRATEIEFDVAGIGLSAVIVEQGDSELQTALQALGLNLIVLAPDSAKSGFFELEGLVQRPGSEAIAPEPDEIAVLFRTSGTTARPKVVPRTQRSLVVGLSDDNGEMQLRPGDCVLNAMPLHHVQGLSGELMYPLLWGATVAIVDFRPSSFLDLVERYQPTKFTLVPSMHRMVLESIGDRKPTLTDSSVRWIESSSAALMPEQKRALEVAYGVPVMQGYGATEAGGMLAPRSFAQQDVPDGSVGKRANEDVVIMDEDGNIVGPGIVGEICVRSTGNIPGYLNNPQADAEAFRSGYYRTGDLGVINDSDYLFVVGRVLDTINRGGEKFSPAEIDEVLLRHADVTHAAAFGVHDEKLGQDVWAAVVLKSGAKTTAQDVRAFAATRLNFARVPKRVIVVDELPHNELGKLMRRELASSLAQC